MYYFDYTLFERDHLLKGISFPTPRLIQSDEIAHLSLAEAGDWHPQAWRRRAPNTSPDFLHQLCPLSVLGIPEVVAVLKLKGLKRKVLNIILNKI